MIVCLFVCIFSSAGGKTVPVTASTASNEIVSVLLNKFGLKVGSVVGTTVILLSFHSCRHIFKEERGTFSLYSRARLFKNELNLAQGNAKFLYLKTRIPLFIKYC